jgi:hypothetical protein
MLFKPVVRDFSFFNLLCAVGATNQNVNYHFFTPIITKREPAGIPLLE